MIGFGDTLFRDLSNAEGRGKNYLFYLGKNFIAQSHD